MSRSSIALIPETILYRLPTARKFIFPKFSFINSPIILNPMHIIWRLMFRVNDRASLDVCLKPILPLFGSNHSLEDCKPYWKIPELWECTITTPAQGSSTADQVLDALITANQLATGWLILGSLSRDSPVDFSGVCDKKQSSTHTHFPNLKWASFKFATDLTASK